MDEAANESSAPLAAPQLTITQIVRMPYHECFFCKQGAHCLPFDCIVDNEDVEVHVCRDCVAGWVHYTANMQVQRPHSSSDWGGEFRWYNIPEGADRRFYFHPNMAGRQAGLERWREISNQPRMATWGPGTTETAESRRIRALYDGLPPYTEAQMRTTPEIRVADIRVADIRDPELEAQVEDGFDRIFSAQRRLSEQFLREIDNAAISLSPQVHVSASDNVPESTRRIVEEEANRVLAQTTSAVEQTS